MWANPFFNSTATEKQSYKRGGGGTRACALRFKQILYIYIYIYTSCIWSCIYTYIYINIYIYIYTYIYIYIYIVNIYLISRTINNMFLLLSFVLSTTIIVHWISSTASYLYTSSILSSMFNIFVVSVTIYNIQGRRTSWDPALPDPGRFGAV